MTRALWTIICLGLFACAPSQPEVPLTLWGVPADAALLTLRVTHDGVMAPEEGRDIRAAAMERRQLRLVLKAPAGALQVEALVYAEDAGRCLLASGRGEGDERGVTVRLGAAPPCVPGDTAAIQQIIPDRAGVEGGARLTLIGTGFVTGQRYLFDGQEATEVKVESQSRVQLTVPPARSRAALGRPIPVRIDGYAERTDLFRYFERDLRLVPAVTVIRGLSGAEFGIVIGDMDGDGWADLVGTGIDRQSALLFRNQAGVFSESTALPPRTLTMPLMTDGYAGLCSPPYLTVDLDRDGDLDFLYTCTDSKTTSRLLTRDAVAGDQPTANKPRVHLEIPYTTHYIARPVVGQADDTPLPDLFVPLIRFPGSQSLLRVLRGQPGGFAQAGADCPLNGGIYLADADHNGRDDVFLPADTSIELIRTDPFGACQVIGAPISYSEYTGRTPQRGDLFAVGDLDGDGLPDLLISLDNYGYVLRKGKVNGGFYEEIFRFQIGVHTPPGRYHDSLLADFNGDGLLDLALGSTNGNSLQLIVLLNQGQGRFPKIGEPGSVQWSSEIGKDPPNGGVMRVGDLDNDGRLDLVFTYTLSGQDVSAQVLLNRPVN